MPATIFITTGKIGSSEAFYDHEDISSGNQGISMNEEEVRNISASALISIGAHTVHHPNLAELSSIDQQKEIMDSKSTLEKITGSPIGSFAYPYGSPDSFSKETVSLVKQAGFDFACANIQAKASHHSDIFTLPRMLVRDWDIKTLKKHLDHA